MRVHSLAAGCALVVVLLFGTATSALGWTVTSPNIYIVNLARGASDSGAQTFRVYVKSGAPSGSAYADGSWEATSGWSYVTSLTVPADCDQMSYRNSGYNYTLLARTSPTVLNLMVATMGDGGVTFPVYLTSSTGTVTALPMAVHESSQVGTVAVSSLPSVSLSGSQSVSIPATVTASLGGWESDALVSAALLFALLAGVHGVVMVAKKKAGRHV